jgi:hypothetical protein
MRALFGMWSQSNPLPIASTCSCTVDGVFSIECDDDDGNDDVGGGGGGGGGGSG